MKSIFHDTSSSLRGGREPGWQSIADYRQPLMLYLGARFAGLPLQDREDLVHNILLEIKQKLYKEYQSERGRFRQFLCGVVRNRVLAYLKKTRREQLCPHDFFEEARFSHDVRVSVEILAEAFGAVRRWLEARHDGPDALKRLAVFSRRLARRETHAQIAEAEKVAAHTVKRWLKEAREAVVADLLAHTLELAPEKAAGVDLSRLARAVLRAFPRGSQRVRALDEVADAELREALLHWMAELDQALACSPQQELVDGLELQRGLEAMLGGED